MSTVERANPIPSGMCQTGALRLSSLLRKRFNLGDLGCYNPFSRMSGGGPSWHVHGEAIDLACNWFDPAQRARGLDCYAYVFEHREPLNLQQMIFGSNIYDVSYGERAYHHDDHKNHIHIALGHYAAANFDESWLLGGVTNPPVPPKPKPPTPKDDDEMYRIIQGDKSPDIWLTNWLEKRKVGDIEEAAAIMRAGVTDGANTVLWPQHYIDMIPIKNNDTQTEPN